MPQKHLLHLGLPITLSIFLLILCFSVFLPGQAAQDTILQDANHAQTAIFTDGKWESFTNGNYVQDVLVHNDTLWAAITGGVVRWTVNDEDNYIKYTTADGLPDNNVTSIAVDQSGMLWFGTLGGIAYFDGLDWAFYNQANSDLPSDSVHDIDFDSSGKLWAATGRGAAVFDGSDWTVYDSYNSELPSNTIIALVAKNDEIWFGTQRDGIAILTNTLWITHTFEDYGSQRILDLAVDGDGNIWSISGNSLGSHGGCFGGLNKYDGITWSTYTTTHGLPTRCLFSVAPQPDGDLWVGTEFGAARFDGATFTTYTTTHGLTDDFVKAIAFSDSSVWFGTYGGGISQGTDLGTNSATWATYATRNAIAHNDIWSVASANGEAWFGSGDYILWNGGLTRYYGYEWQTFTSENSPLPNNEVRAIAVDNNGDRWFGTWGGATRYDGTNWTTYTKDDGLPYYDPVRTIVTQGTDLWIAAYHPFCKNNDHFEKPCGGIAKFDSTDWVSYTITDGLQSDYVYDIAISGNEIWYSTDEGIGMFDGADWTNYTETDGLVSSNQYYAIAVDLSGDIWVGSSDHGVSKFDGTNWTTYTEVDGLSSNRISEIVLDSGGNLWFGTANGLTIFNGTDWFSYTIADGLADNYIKALAFDDNGIIWVGTSAGLSVFLPESSEIIPPESCGVVTSPDGDVEVILPPGAMDSTTTFTYTEQHAPTQATGGLVFGGTSFQLEAVDESGDPVITFTVPLTLSITYDPAQLMGIPEEDLLIYYWDENQQIWFDVAETCTPATEYIRDIENNQLTIEICHLTEFALVTKENQMIYLPLITR